MAGESETSPVVEEVEKPSAITPVAPLTTKTTADADKHSLVLHLTGFGPFQGVPDNPTSTLMQILPSYLSLGDRPLPPSVKCASFTVLETSFKGSRSQLGVIQETGASAYTGGHTIYLHIGVDAQSLGYKLEACAYNMMSSIISDEQGFMPSEMPVRKEDVLGMVRETGLPVDMLVQKMRTSGWGKVTKSMNPGGFVCNSTNYVNRHSLFLHVPPFAVFNSEQQAHFIQDLIICLAEIVNSVHEDV